MTSPCTTKQSHPNDDRLHRLLQQKEIRDEEAVVMLLSYTFKSGHFGSLEIPSRYNIEEQPLSITASEEESLLKKTNASTLSIGFKYVYYVLYCDLVIRLYASSK